MKNKIFRAIHIVLKKDGKKIFVFEKFVLLLMKVLGLKACGIVFRKVRRMVNYILLLRWA